MSFFQIQATGLRPTSGISMSGKAPFVQDLSHHSCVIAILWRALPIQAISMVVLSQQMTSNISTVKLLWRTSLSSKGMQRGFSSKQHVFVYGHQIMEETQKVLTCMARVTRKLNRLRRIQPGWLQQWQAKASLQPPRPSTAPLQTPFQHLHRYQLKHHLLPQLHAFQSKQFRYLRIQACQVLQGMCRFQALKEQIHGHAISLGASEADPRRSSEQ